MKKIGLIHKILMWKWRDDQSIEKKKFVKYSKCLEQIYDEQSNCINDLDLNHLYNLIIRTYNNNKTTKL